MSYSTTIGPQPKDQFTDKAVRAALDQAQAPVAEANPEQTEAMAHQAHWLVAAIVAGVEVVGPDDARVHVAISGHANPDHTPEGGWAPDAVTLTISHTLVA